MLYYTYTLASPDEKVFYVGKGCRDRIDYHEEEAYLPLDKQSNRRKCDVIRTIHTSGGQVLKKRVFETSTERDAFLYEWILINLVYGSATLTNGNDGNNAKRKPRISKKREKEFLSIDEIAERLGISRNTVLKHLITPGKLPVTRIGRQYRISGKDFEEYLKQSKGSPDEQKE